MLYCFTLDYCNVECSFVDGINNTPMIQSIVNFVFLISSRSNRTVLVNKKVASLFRRVGRKKNLFSYALQL